MSLDYAFKEAKKAISAGDVQSLKRLLQQFPGLANHRLAADRLGNQNTLLHECTGMATLSWATTAPEIAQLLIDAGADVNATEKILGGETPLIHAVSVNNVPVAKVLLENGADTEQQGRHDGSIDTALGYALFDGTDTRLEQFERNCPELLLDYGAKCYLPFAAALAKSLHGYFSESGQLLPHASPLADRQMVLQQGLLFAAKYGQLESAKLLLEQGAEINACIPFFHFNATALHLACENGERLAMVEFLLEKGADWKQKDATYHGTALDWAMHCKQPRVLAYLRSVTSEH